MPGVSSKKPTPLVEMDYEEFRRVQQINVDGVFFTFRAAARHMVKSGTGGSLVATASTAAVEGAARNSHYGASKGAGHVVLPRARRRTGPSQDPGEFHSAGLDRHRHDRARPRPTRSSRPT
jgi:NAD(P)-dependent dehydrogenase (short-subunit alcohol dehydrogenase family)